MNFLFGVIFSMVIFSVSQAHAIVLFGSDNSANLTNPGTGAPFDSVARLSDGSGTIGGSGIYLGNGYVLTAGHVSPFSTVSFNGTDSFSYDGTSVVAIGTTDMKIFRLTSLPLVSAVNLYTGSSESGQKGTLVGWGVGRNSGTPVNSNTVPWGDASTSAKRWGLTSTIFTNNVNSGGYIYNALVYEANRNEGASAAAATLYDSGSGLFQFLNGQWVLTGLTTAVSTNGSSTFKSNPISSGDNNIFVQISPYASQINALIIPESSSFFLAATGFLLLFQRRRLHKR